MRVSLFFYSFFFISLSFAAPIQEGISYEETGGSELTEVQEETPDFELVKIPEPKKVVPKKKAKKKSHKGIVSTGRSFRGLCRQSNESSMKNTLKHVNAHRRRYGRVPLKWSTSCGKFANFVAKRNADAGRSGIDIRHYDRLKNQNQVRSIMKSLGLDYNLSNFNENVAWGGKFSGGSRLEPPLCRPIEVIKGWISSPGHNKNMLDSRWRYMGISRIIARNGEVHWAQCFHK